MTKWWWWGRGSPYPSPPPNYYVTDSNLLKKRDPYLTEGRIQTILRLKTVEFFYSY